MNSCRSLNNRLLALKNTFDEAIIKGKSFEEVKKMYMEIKDIEKQIVEWELEMLREGRLEE